WSSGSRSDGRCSRRTDCSSSSPASSAFPRSSCASSSRGPRVIPATHTRRRDGPRVCGRLARAIASAAALLLAVGSVRAAHGASRFDPALTFRVLATEHFVIHFDRNEERAARRLAAIAEETWRALQRPLGVVPPRLTHVVLADQTEFANGYATPLPYDTIVIYTVWPSAPEFVFDDWLRLAFTHEFTHIVHLDRSEGRSEEH